MAGLALEVRREKFPLAAPFRIAGYVFEQTEVVVVTLSDGTCRGRGEGNGVYYLGDDAKHMEMEIEAARREIERGVTREELQTLMPAGGGRNAVDCALWDLEAAQLGEPAWQIAGLETLPQPLVTTFTLGADDPDKMASAAIANGEARALKLKLTGELDLDIARVRKVRAARNDVWLGVDANQGFDRRELDDLVAALLECDVALLEQPLARGKEADLDGFKCSIPIAADESALTLADVEGLVGRFDIFNIKLDKCGGLPEALQIALACRKAGLGLMIGNMAGTSLAMAPAFVVGQYCDVVDLDGPTFLARDRNPGVSYKDGKVWSPDEIWGAAGLMSPK